MKTTYTIDNSVLNVFRFEKKLLSFNSYLPLVENGNEHKAQFGKFKSLKLSIFQ